MFKLHVYFLLICIVFANCQTDTPIIGILSEEGDNDSSYESMIVASYVKYLESAGARVIPVWIGASEEYYNRVVNYTNGILFPGGAVNFNETGGYGEAARILFKLAELKNNEGIYYPLWGTCLGLEVIVYAYFNGEDISLERKLEYTPVPLNFSEEYQQSKLFKDIPESVLNILKTENVTYNNHEYGFSSEDLKQHGFLNDWTILTTNIDVNGLEFVSSFESKKYPFYGVQFHPEKNVYEFKENESIPHTNDATRISHYFATYFVNESRKSSNSFPNLDLEKHSLIYNYVPVYTGLQNSSYEQTYTFTKDDVINNQLV